MSRPIVGIMRKAAVRQPGLVGLRGHMVDVVEDSEQIFESFSRLVLRLRVVIDKPAYTASDEDEQIIEQVQIAQRQMFFVAERIRKILDEGPTVKRESDVDWYLRQTRGTS